MGRLAVNNLSVSRGRRRVLSNLTLTLSPGTTALLGRNGAGKTTLIRTLAGVQRPSAGTVTREGQDIFDSTGAMRQHRSSLGWVPQGPGYPRDMSVNQFVEYAAWLKKISSNTRVFEAQKALAACNMAHMATRRLGALSGGERQRVILAAAIVGRPAVLLLDEPTVGLDPAQRSDYLELLGRIGQTATILYSTHLVEDVVNTATRVLIVNEGRLSQDFAESDLRRKSGSLGEFLRQAVVGVGGDSF